MQTVFFKNIKREKTIPLLFTFFAATILLTLAKDKLESSFKGYIFYWSESFLFGLFWWLFVPFTTIQLKFFQKNHSYKWWTIPVLSVIHFLSFPLLVLICSYFFFEQTYGYFVTLQYTISTYLIQTPMIYLFSALIVRYYFEKNKILNNQTQNSNISNASFIEVKEKDRKIALALNDIISIHASTPYIILHTKEKKYWHLSSLKSFQEKHPFPNWIRIHKSIIINSSKIKYYTSRKNGDYDVEMMNGEKVRLSRNYVANFKKTVFQNSSG